VYAVNVPGEDMDPKKGSQRIVDLKKGRWQEKNDKRKRCTKAQTKEVEVMN
jgi:hypothetical protein